MNMNVPGSLSPTQVQDVSAQTLDADQAADRLSANCFFNALLRETQAAVWVEDLITTLPEGMKQPALRIALPESGNCLWLAVAYRSYCGRHQFDLPIILENAEGRRNAINLALAVHAIASEPSIFPQAQSSQRHRFTERAQASIRNMGQAIAARQDDLAAMFVQPMSFAESEQALLCGHSIHPTPKSREPFTDEDAAIYAPEFGNAFELQWIAVTPNHLQGSSGCQQTAAELAQQVWTCDGQPQGIPDGHVPVPMHPWQWQRLRQQDHIASLLDKGEIVELGAGDKPWRATSSLRAIYGAHSPYMLKFSLSLRLTNSLRTLLPHEMARGLEVPQVRATPVGQAFAERYPDFAVLAEPAFIMLRNEAGEGMPESMVLFRENPFLEDAAENTCLLATLTQDNPQPGTHCRAAQLIAQYARRQQLGNEQASSEWFSRFLDAVIEPLFIAQADYGLLYGAHQQNLIIRFDQELPKAGYFRDCQGSGYSQLGERLLRPHMPKLGDGTENVIDDEMANRLFAYYLIVNSCFGLISAIAASGLTTEEALLQQLRERLEALQAGPRQDRSCLNYLLEADELWAKGNFHCAIIGMNESTSEDPLSIYHRMPNALQRSQSTNLRKSA